MSHNKYFGLGVLALKLAPKLLKLVKSFKILGAVASAGVYTWLFSWQMAIAILVLLFVHEYGHIWAMKRTNMKVRGIYFIPFLGGAAVPDDQFRSRKQEAFVAIMGPVFGLGLSLLVLLVYFITGNQVFAGVAAWMAFINAFQFLPINPMDGGRIVKSIFMSIKDKIGIVVVSLGFVLALYLLFKLHLWLFIIMLPIGILEFILELKYSKKTEIDAKRPTIARAMHDIQKNMWMLNQNKMNAREMVLYSIYTVVVLSALLSIMIFAKDIPGAGEALHILM